VTNDISIFSGAIDTPYNVTSSSIVETKLLSSADSGKVVQNTQIPQ
jgi:hypothetical protein